MVTLGKNNAVGSALRQLSQHTSELSGTFERLSSGMRINRASDDAAGLSISENLNFNIRVQTQAIKNLNDGISANAIAESAIRGLSDVSIRLEELATQSANGVYSATQRRAMQNESTALINEFNRVVESTKFNGRSLLENPLQPMYLQAGQGEGAILATTIGAELSRNIGTGNFASPTNTTLSLAAGATAVSADFDNDGVLDLVVADYYNGFGGQLSFLKNDGSGNFTELNTISIPSTSAGSSYQEQMLVGDFDGDDDADIAILSKGKDSLVDNSIISILSNDGTGSFTVAKTYEIDPFAQGLNTADINGDGRLDFVYSENSNVHILTSTGGFNHTNTTIAVSSAPTGQLVVGDINGDERADIVMANASGNVTFLRNSGTGTFNSSSFAFSPGGSEQVALGDFNNDGSQDLAVIGNLGADLRIYRNGVSGNFTLFASQTLPSAASSSSANYRINFKDLDNDGYLDLVQSGKSSLGYLNNQFIAIMNKGSGTSFVQKTPIHVPANFGGAVGAFGDFNGDGVLDLAAASDLGISLYGAVTEATNKIGQLNLMTRQEALNSLTTIQGIRQRIAEELGSIGAQTSRITAATQVLSANVVANAGARSRLLDVDVAEQAAKLIKNNILQQVSAKLVSQIQISQKTVLELLLE